MAEHHEFSFRNTDDGFTHSEWLRALRDAGVVPLGVDADLSARSLVAWLIALWTAKALAASVAQQRGLRRLIAQLKVLDAGVAEFTIFNVSRPPFGRRVVFAPKGQPKLPRVGIVSSRLKRQTALEQVWLAALRDACLQTKNAGQALLAVEGTVADRFVRRCGELFEIPTVAVRTGEAHDEIDGWFKQSLRDFAETAQPANVFPIYVSPPLGTDSTENENLPSSPFDDAPDVPQRDRILVEWSDQVVALALRAGGNCEWLLRDRLSATSPASVQLCGGEQLISPRLSDELRGLGATLLGSFQTWVAADVSGKALAAGSAKGPAASALPLTSSRTCYQTKPRFEPCPLLDVAVDEPQASSLAMGSTLDRAASDAARKSLLADAATPGMFLTHWTRGLEAVALKDLGDEQLDEWLRQPKTLDRSAFASLRCFVQERCLRGSRTGQRGVVRAVCFSAVPLTELMKHRTYRVHRTRWDCEPYGLCVRRDALQKLGARPVVYGDESDFASLPVEDRAWFQARFSQLKSQTIDWSDEQEWRLPGDLDLSLLSPSDAFVFVKTNAEVAQIEPHCDWPVVAMFPDAD